MKISTTVINENNAHFTRSKTVQQSANSFMTALSCKVNYERIFLGETSTPSSPSFVTKRQIKLPNKSTFTTSEPHQ